MRIKNPMSSGELILTLFVALLVFGPQKMPMLARHLAWLVKRCQAWQQQGLALWNQLQLQNQLQSNLEKAKVAEEEYSQRNYSSSPEIPTSRGLSAGSRDL